MNFLWPQFLWLLALLPVLLLLYVWLLRRKKKLALRYASLSLVREAMGTGQSVRRHVPPLLFLALAGGGAMLGWCAGILLLNHELKTELITMTRQLSQRLAPRPARR